MKIKRIVLFILLLILGGLSYYHFGRHRATGTRFLSLAQSEAVGYLPAELSVSSAGTPNYGLNLRVPPGTNNVQPEIGLSYSSVASNGMLGMGWNLEGITSITRVGRMIPVDGIKGGVFLDSNDRFELGGQRLIAYKDAAGNELLGIEAQAAAYGKDGTEYRTEIESWTRVFSIGNCGGGPCKFIAYLRDGSRAEYGFTPDSRTTAAGNPVVISWGVNQVTDRNGNYVAINYLNDPSQALCFPTGITYTGNIRTGLAPQRLIKINHETRPDTILSTVGGIRMAMPYRISGIETYVDVDGDGKGLSDADNLVNAYSFTYEISPITGRSRITSIGCSDANGNHLPPTHFESSGSASDPAMADSLLTLSVKFKNQLNRTDVWVKGDFNGDSRIDIAFLKKFNDSVPIAFVSESGFTMKSFYVPVAYRPYLEDKDIHQVISDFNGDGLTDMAFFKEGVQSLPILYSNGYNGFKGVLQSLPSGWGKIINLPGAQRFTGDFNGDGLSDIAGFSPNWKSIPVLLAQPGGGFTNSLLPLDPLVANTFNTPGASYETGDFNGDGLTDIASVIPNASQLPILFSRGNGTFRATSRTLPAKVKLAMHAAGVQRYIGDFNGDRLHDIALIVPGTRSVSLAISNGEGGFDGGLVPVTPAVAGILMSPSATLFTGDLNGDYQLDIAAIRRTDGRMAAILSYGNGRFLDSVIGLSPTVASLFTGASADRFIGDFNGDGLTDIAALEKTFSRLPVLYARKVSVSNSLPDMILKATNGVNKVVTLSYEPYLTRGFSVDTTLQYPLRSVVSPMYVAVSSSELSAPTDPVSILTKTYTYDSALVDSYRGWRGFRFNSIHDHPTETKTSSRVLVAFPYFGQVARTTVSDYRNGLLMNADNSVYRQQSKAGSQIYTIARNSTWKDYYSNGNYNFTTRKDIAYSPDLSRMLSVYNQADTSEREDDYYLLFNYGSYAADTLNFWKAFYPVEEKTSGNGNSGFSTWGSGDYSWYRYGYDQFMNVVTSRSYVDSGSVVNASWIGDAFVYDEYGNEVLKKSPANFFRDSIRFQTDFDPVYHTFPHTVTSPKLAGENGKTYNLITQLEYEPRFGTLVGQIDPNGNVLLSVPDSGIDGFGRLLRTEEQLPSGSDLTVKSLQRYKSWSGGYAVSVLKPNSWTNSGKPDEQWFEVTSFLDGFDRTTSEATNGPVADTNVVSRQAYDRKGRLVREYLPAFQPSAQASGGGTTGLADTIAIRRVYNRHGVLKQIYTPDPDRPGSYFLSKEFLYDSLDFRILVIVEPSPQTDGQVISWKHIFGSNGELKSREGPYLQDGSKAPDFATVTYQYDPLGRMIRLTDPLGQESRFYYNSLGFKFRQFSPEIGMTRKVYNANDWVVLESDAIGSTEWTYDDMGRPLFKLVRDVANLRVDSARYVYDNTSISANGLGQLCSVTYPAGSAQFDYDNLGNETNKRTRVNELETTFTESTLTNPLGKVVHQTYPNGDTLRYNYNLASNLEQVFCDGREVSAIDQYNAYGLPGRIRFANGVVTTNAYDILGRPVQAVTNKNAYVHASFGYNWNDANKVYGIADRRVNVADTMKLNQQLSYYATGRLYTANGAYGTFTFSYDLAGNALSNGEYNYTYDPVKKHQLSGISKGGKELFNLAYDAVGNLIDKENAGTGNGTSVQYTFDPLNRLLAVNTAQGRPINSFAYNDLGDRVIKRDSSGTTTYYISEGFEVVKLPDSTLMSTSYVYGAGQLIYSQTARSAGLDRMLNKEKRGSFFFFNWRMDLLLLGLILIALVVALQTIIPLVRRQLKLPVSPLRKAVLFFACWGLLMQPAFANFQPGPNGPGIPVDGEVRYYHENLVGSSTMLTDQTGGLANSISYKPFGSIDTGHTTGKNDFRAKFTGKEQDADIGLYYFGSRYYDSDLGRFISPDPMEQYNSPYVYGADDPFSGVDPDGNFFFVFGFASLLIDAMVIGAYVGASEANNSFNPAKWNWNSSNTWMGMLDGAVAAATLVVSAAAIVISFGTATPEVVALDEAINVLMMALDSYTFARDQSVLNGVALGLDLVPFVGPLLGRIGKSAKAVKQIDRDVEMMDMGAKGLSKETKVEDFAMCKFSFTAGTVVQLNARKRAIDRVQVGDEVVSYDDGEAEIRNHAVTRIFTRLATGLVLVVTSAGDTLASTYEHPFYLSNYTEIEAGKLRAGDELLALPYDESSAVSYQEALRPAKVSEVLFYPDSVVQVFNIEIEEAHNYFVGWSGYLVHNPKWCGKVGIGGRHGVTKGYAERWLFESNHFPAASSYRGTPYSMVGRDYMPAVTMPYKAHRMAKSTGSSFIAVAWRARQTKFLKAGNFEAAMRMDIQDMIRVVRRVSPKSVPEMRRGIEDAVDYSESVGFLSYASAKRLRSAARNKY